MMVPEFNPYMPPGTEKTPEQHALPTDKGEEYPLNSYLSGGNFNIAPELIK